MNLTTLLRTSSLTLTPKMTSRTLIPSIQTKPISSSLIPNTPTSLNPVKTPLFLKPPIFTTSLSDLLSFRFWAKTQINKPLKDSKDSNNDLNPAHLYKELNWLIQDSLKDPNLLKTHEYYDESKSLVELRIDINDLYELWNERIIKRRPFQYIVGCEYWRDLVLSVEEGVLIPRPETELIVDLVSDVVKEGELGDGVWVDLGTGSGAIAIGVGRVLGEMGRVVGVDLSCVAVRVASFNVERYNLQDKISIKQGSWFEPLSEYQGQVSGLVSNPPYIPSGHIDGLQPEVGRHEPILALDGGENGMSDLLHICNGAASLLKSGGFFAFETNGDDQCKFLVEHMETIHKDSFCNLKIVPDFAGIQRFVTGYRS